MNLPLVFIRHARARRYVIRVRQDGTVRVTVPRWGSKRDAEIFAHQQHDWIERQRRRIASASEHAFVSPYSPAEIRDLRSRAGRELPDALLRLAADYGLTVSRVSVRNQRWRWGSCSAKGHICLNWRLILMPDDVRAYVLAHELMHLKRLDHSRAFWKLVRTVHPAFREARAWLRSEGANLLMVGRFPDR